MKIMRQKLEYTSKYTFGFRSFLLVSFFFFFDFFGTEDDLDIVFV